MAKTKEAVSDAETATRVKRLLLSREEQKNMVDTLFNHSHESRKTARGTVDKLFVQADASQNQHPFMQKEAVAKNVTEFFEKKAHLTQAQRLFPELLKVGATDTQRQMVTKKPAGATPTKPIISGDQQ